MRNSSSGRMSPRKLTQTICFILIVVMQLIVPLMPEGWTWPSVLALVLCQHYCCWCQELQVKDANGTLLGAGWAECSTLIFVITRIIIAFLVLQWSEIIVTADEDLPLPTTDVSSLPANRDDTRRFLFLFLPFLNGLSTSTNLPYGQKSAHSLCPERNLDDVDRAASRWTQRLTVLVKSIGMRSVPQTYRLCRWRSEEEISAPSIKWPTVVRSEKVRQSLWSVCRENCGLVTRVSLWILTIVSIWYERTSSPNPFDNGRVYRSRMHKMIVRWHFSIELTTRPAECWFDPKLPHPSMIVETRGKSRWAKFSVV